MIKQNHHIEIIMLALVTGALFGFIGFLASVSSGIEGGMDSYNHYLIARYSWSYPSLFLDQWGKPLYSLIASPFVQFGISGAIVLNCLSLLGCAILVYKIVNKLGLKCAWLGYLFTLTSPIFLDNTISALTEPLCALLVTYTIYLYLSKHFVAAAILAGFLPFARSEGFIILFAIVVFLVLVDKQYKTIVYALLGSFVFNILGWIIEGEPLWIITSNPYINFELSGRNVCGSGGLSHYFYAGHYTFGFIATLLMALCAFVYATALLTKRKFIDYSMGLIVLSFGLYFASHVVIWWLGKMGSCGYVRVMVVIAPLAAIMMVYALNFTLTKCSEYVKHNVGVYKNLILTFLVINSIYAPYRYYAYKYPLEISAEQAEYKKLAKWYKKEQLQERRKIYLYPYFSILSDINPYDQTQHLEFWNSSLQFSEVGDILIWDGHFGPHESGTPLPTLEQDSSWQKIHNIIPENPILTLNDKEFEIHVFEKIK